MPTVFVPHLTNRFEAQLGRRVPVKDISQATQFGNLEIIIESAGSVAFIPSMQEEVARKMANFKDGDYILAIGDPVIIAACAIQAAKCGKEILFLKWNRATSTYHHERVSV